MQNNTIKLEITSPKELQKQLEAMAKDKKANAHFAELEIYGSSILMRQFDLPHLVPHELVKSLKLEAVEILSLSLKAIKLDYKVIDSSGDRIRGIFIAMPKATLHEYTRRFTPLGIIPVKLNAGCLAALGRFLAENPEAIKNNFCFLDFPKYNIVNMVVFINGQCELIREIAYENLEEAEGIVIDSLKYSYGKSVIKQLNKLYFSGNLAGKEELVQRLESKIEIEPKAAFTGQSLNSLNVMQQELFSKLNLLKKYSSLLLIRNGILFAERALLALALFLCLITGIKACQGSQSARKLRRSINAKDYEHARTLQEEVRSSQYAK